MEKWKNEKMEKIEKARAKAIREYLWANDNFWRVLNNIFDNLLFETEQDILLFLITTLVKNIEATTKANCYKWAIMEYYQEPSEANWNEAKGQFLTDLIKLFVD